MTEEKRPSGDRGYLLGGQFFAAPKPAPGLYVVATPIGHLKDITIRALETLAGVDLIAAEDTRVTRKLLSRYGIATRMTSYHEHSGLDADRRLLQMLSEERAIALVSDAGTPLISDPGERLVAAVAAAGHPVIPIPGASSVMAVLAASGLPAREFLFVGFLPSKQSARRRRLAELATSEATLVLFESPNRIGALLDDAITELGGEREAVLARELTKLHETIDRGTLQALVGRNGGGAAKGEIVLLVAPSTAREKPSARDVDQLLVDALASEGVKQAAADVARATGLPRRELYQRALSLRAAMDERR